LISEEVEVTYRASHLPVRALRADDEDGEVRLPTGSALVGNLVEEWAEVVGDADDWAATSPSLRGIRPGRQGSDVLRMVWKVALLEQSASRNTGSPVTRPRPGTKELLRPLDADVVIPGHGSAVHDTPNQAPTSRPNTHSQADPETVRSVDQPYQRQEHLMLATLSLRLLGLGTVLRVRSFDGGRCVLTAG
jgi:hypothetical protein